MKALIYLLCLLLLAASFALGRATAPDAEPEYVETVRIDTVRVVQPEIVVVRPRPAVVETLAVAAADSVGTGDSVAVKVDYEQRVYAGQNYRAFVSGHNPRLDTIEIFQPIRQRSSFVQRRVSVGVQVGYGLTPRGVQPYVGLGVAIRLF